MSHLVCTEISQENVNPISFVLEAVGGGGGGGGESGGLSQSPGFSCPVLTCPAVPYFTGPDLSLAIDTTPSWTPPGPPCTDNPTPAPTCPLGERISWCLVRKCFWRLTFCVNRLSHLGQGKGFSPVCVRKCLARWAGVRWVDPHTVHWWR